MWKHHKKHKEIIDPQKRSRILHFFLKIYYYSFYTKLKYVSVSGLLHPDI